MYSVQCTVYSVQEYLCLTDAVTQDVYGEPLSHGWGVDLPGIGDTLRFTGVQAHSLKPAAAPNTDGHMLYRIQTAFLENINRKI